jgi:peptide/nickel transport system permease protein
MGALLQGDLGSGIKSNIPVWDDLKARFPATAELSVAALLFALLIGMPAGILAALRRNSMWDNLATTISLVGVSMPVFWLGLLLSYFFAVKLGWLPPSARLGSEVNLEPVTGFYVLDGLLRGQPAAAWDALRHLILPAIALGSIPLAIIARITRSSMLDVLGQDYVRTARAKGLTGRAVTFKHALRNALLPVVTVIGLQAGALLGGAVLTETIFSWPGIGSWVYDAISQRDYPIIQGGVIFAALIVSLANLIVDLSYAALDPRIQYS